MSQILHIFRKDTRRFWPEILLNLAITAALVWFGPYQWMADAFSEGNYRLQMLRQLSEMIVPLMLIAWMLLISRVVHAEPLVGDRQFWITKPFDWKKLLAAKVLFGAAYVYLPFVAMQSILMLRAGFSPAHALPAIVFNLMLVSGALIFPLVAFATITSNFGRMVLITMGALLCLWLMMAMYQVTLSRSSAGVDVRTPLGGMLSFALGLAICGVVILLQYSARKTRVAAGLMIGLVVCVFCIRFLIPERALISPIYAHASGSETEPVQIAFDTATASHSFSREGWGNSDRVGVALPVLVSGVSGGHTLLFDNVKFTLDGPNGMHWSSPWQGLARGSQESGEDAGHARIDLRLPEAVYDELAKAPLHVHLTLALTEAKVDRVTTISNSGDEFSVAGFGYCGFRGLRKASPTNAFLACRYSLGTPLTQIATSWTYRPCNPKTGAAPDVQKQLSIGWSGSSGVASSSMQLTPINTQNYSFAGVSTKDSVAMCPHEPTVTFTQYQPVRRMQVTLDASDFRLAPLVPEEQQ